VGRDGMLTLSVTTARSASFRGLACGRVRAGYGCGADDCQRQALVRRIRCRGGAFGRVGRRLSRQAGHADRGEIGLRLLADGSRRRPHWPGPLSPHFRNCWLSGALADTQPSTTRARGASTDVAVVTCGGGGAGLAAEVRAPRRRRRLPFDSARAFRLGGARRLFVEWERRSASFQTLACRCSAAEAWTPLDE